MSDTRIPCPKCGAYTGHGVECTGMTVEEKAEKMMHYYEAWRKKCNEHHDIQVKWQTYAVMWQGKCAMLRQENNKLRRALYKQEIKKKAGRPSSKE